MSGTYWILEEIEGEKFPYRLNIVQDQKAILCLRVQERWPGTKGQIFCLSEEARGQAPPGLEIERVPIVSLKRYGKRLAVVLDRSKNKRCDFLFLKKPYKTKQGEYQQIFWRTQQALQARRPRVKLTLQGKESLRILVEANEKYPWRFLGCQVQRGSLPVGDYALEGNYGFLAIVERKTFENMLSEFGRMSIFHQVLGELEAYEHNALVIEATYADFLKPDRLKFYSPAFTAKAIAEVCVMHPKLNIIFAGNRKLANEWTLRFFSAIKSHEDDKPLPKVTEAMAEYRSSPAWKGGAYFTVRKILDEMPRQFTVAMLRAACPNISDTTIRKALNDLKKEDKIKSQGRGSRSYWEKL